LLDVPYEVALRKISEPLDFTLKIEGGKLVAAPRRGVSAPETRAATVAGRLPDSPRIPVEDYRGAFRDLTPLYMRWRFAGADHCARMTFASGPTYDAGGAAITQFGWDPVTRTRLIAVDGPDRLRAVAVAEPPALPGKLVFGDALALLPQEPSSGPCPDAGGHVAKGTPEMVFLRVDEIREDGSRFALAVPRMLVRPGAPFSFRTRIADPAGQAREIVVSGYLAADGRSVVASLAATALRTDADGREYVYAQSTARDSGDSSVPLTTLLLSEDETLVASLGTGSALSRPVELRIFRREK
ncbi:MAG TPA: hypothetical protein VIZ69_10155, partial [Thermoanaerobaculia bacterium]